MTNPITEDEFREMHAQHLRDEAGHIQRQTEALETIRSVLVVLMLLVVLGVILGAVAAFA